MNLDDITLNSVKYQVQAFTIDAGGKTFDVPSSQVMSIKIEKNFEMNIYPFVYVGVNIPYWFYAEVVKNPDNLHITMDLHSLQYRSEFNESILKKSTKSELKGRFLAEVAIDTPVLFESDQNQLAKDEGTLNKGYLFNEYCYTEFTLQNEAAFKAKSKVVNAVLQSTNMTTNIAYICKACGIKDILMSPLSNRANYTEFIIPPINAVDQIKNWIINYGLHDKGTTLFFDLDRVYILNKDINCTAWRNNEYKTVHVMGLTEYSKSLAMGSGYFCNSKEKYHLIAIPPNSLQATSIETIPYSRANLSTTQSVMLYTNDATMESLTPNKLFIVNIQDKSAKDKVNGKYRILRYSVEMEPGGNYMNAKFNITLGK